MIRAAKIKRHLQKKAKTVAINDNRRAGQFAAPVSASVPNEPMADFIRLVRAERLRLQHIQDQLDLALMCDSVSSTRH